MNNLVTTIFLSFITSCCVVLLVITFNTSKTLEIIEKNNTISYDITLSSSNIDESLDLIDGFNTVTVTFPSDTIHLIPVGDSYVLYSYLEEDPFPIDMLYTDDAQSFIWWLSQYPLEPTDHNLENPTEYYRDLLLEKIYE